MGCICPCLKKKSQKDDYLDQNLQDDIEAQQQPERFNINDNDTPLQKGTKLKEKGNLFYKKKEYDKAIECYTEAIGIHEDTFFYSNRAICYKFLQQWERVIQDCQRSIQLDDKNFKAYNYLGISQVKQAIKNNHNLDLQVKELEEGIQNIQKSRQVFIDSKKNNGKNIIESLDKNIGRAKYIKWDKQQQKDKEKKQRALILIEQLLEQEENKQEIYNEIKNEYIIPQPDMEKYNNIPNHLCCPLTFNTFSQPILTNSGFTYEENMINDHLKKNYVDPLTRKPIDQKKNQPNKAIIKATQHFKEQNPWYYAVDNFDDEEL